MIAPVVIACIFQVSPLLTRTADQALAGLRPLLDIDEADFLAMLEQGQATGNLAAEIGERTAYERRLESARLGPMTLPCCAPSACRFSRRWRRL